jgi:L-serine/L-threonine ammonia-lyase
MQSLQPSQSFKYRGLSLFAQQCKEEHGPNVHLIIASGGNAGLAVACAANVLNVRCTVYIPEGVSQRTLDFLTKERAGVVITGKYYVQALQRAEEALKCEENA